MKGAGSGALLTRTRPPLVERCRPGFFLAELDNESVQSRGAIRMEEKRVLCMLVISKRI